VGLISAGIPVVISGERITADCWTACTGLAARVELPGPAAYRGVHD
jgi:hypothetical protein